MADITYWEYAFTVKPIQPGSDILIAELGALGFESFVETGEGILAYINKEDWEEHLLDSLIILKNPEFQCSYQKREIAQQNWNAVWESSFEPILVGDQCVVRAPFHPRSKVVYDIVIAPKMSFGTGHHETTFMMLQHILEQDFKGKSVLDMGSGTGVLSILAEKMGAARIDAIDIDHWCYVNALENVELNQCKKIKVHKGDATLLLGRKYDTILANINRNILIKDIPIYAKRTHLKKEPPSAVDFLHR